MKRDSATLTIRNVPERTSVLKQIEAAWEGQVRRPTAAEIDAWIGVARVA